MSYSSKALFRMRRRLASLLVAVFSFPLIAPVLSLNLTSEVPACCRRSGKHHCANMAEQGQLPAGLAVRAIQPRCPLFPNAGTVAVSCHTVLPSSSSDFRVRLVLRSANRKTDKDIPQIALRGSVLKRGPPCLLRLNQSDLGAVRFKTLRGYQFETIICVYSSIVCMVHRLNCFGAGIR
jgi:hypothetical protein